MKRFTRNELIVVILILAVVFVFTLKGMIEATRRARDFQRRQDIGLISDALHSYHAEFGFFPPSENGRIKACRGGNFDAVIEQLSALPEFDRDLYFSGLQECSWGTDPLKDETDTQKKAYMSILPSDPLRDKGRLYYYTSNTVRFQLYTALEGGEDEIGYNRGIIARGLSCGRAICNYGKSYADMPLNISIEEYEQMLIEQQK